MTMTHLADPFTQPQFYRDVPFKRLMAWLVDAVLVIVLCVVILPFTAFAGLFFFPALFAVIDFAYRIITLTGGSGTLGMRLFAVELRDGSGARFDLGTAFLHTFGYYLSWAVFPLQLVSAILMCTSARGQSLTDMALGTAMLNRRAR